MSPVSLTVLIVAVVTQSVVLLIIQCVLLLRRGKGGSGDRWVLL
ncbi:MAG: hypothetical protein ACFCBU_09150 [Cyanophyceae cyanobacterium]